jgi:branched-subunit amino acid ABC-type transport system permease component
MRRDHRQPFSAIRRFAVVFALTASIAVMFAPEWIEEVFHISPDHGSGQLEWLFAALGVLGVLATSATAIRWVRLPRAPFSNSRPETVTR